MRKQTISVTEAAHNFTDCLNRVQSQNITLVLLKHGAAVARLVPDHEKICTGRDLARLLAGVKLSKNESSAGQRDLKAARKILKRPGVTQPK
jgi:antitoxin (DNA-binding transcriptional repressor) of toxin-antitoxin stability system